jgi:TonB-linked SusC/RagA family outer membrane protein
MQRSSFWKPLAVALAGVLWALPASVAQAQVAIITGQVATEIGTVPAGGVVSITELNLGATIDQQGRYTITVPGARVRGQAVTVTARAIGFRIQSTQITLNSGTFEVNFMLAADVFNMEAIVVTGVTAGTEVAKVPFSVDRIDASDLKVPATNPLTQLAGKVTGANIVSYSGRPGEAPALILRGPKSMNASGRSQEPLYIIDGVIVRGGLPDINAADIQSVEVIKGAAASSLYGAQAGNGVIQITTKSGKNGAEGVRFTFRSEVGAADIERDFGIARRTALVMDETGTRFCVNVSGQPQCARTLDYNQVVDAINNTPTVNVPAPPAFPLDPGASTSGPYLRQRFNIDRWPMPTYNAVDQAIDPHPFQQHTLDATGRLGGTSFYASAAYLGQPGAIRFLDGYDRYSLRLNVDQQVGSALQLGVRTYYNRAVEDGENQEGGGAAFFRLTRAPAAANLLARDTLDRAYVRTNLQSGGLQNENALYSLEYQDRTSYSDRFLGGIDLRFNPLRWLEATGNLNFDVRRETTDYFRDKGYRDPQNNPTNQGGGLNQNMNNTDAINGSLNLATNHRFGDLTIRPNLRYFYEEVGTKYRRLSGSVLAVQGIKAATNATTSVSVTSDVTSTRQISFAGGMDFDLKDRYIVSGVIRRDGSSRFGLENRWDTYGRISGAWRVSEEPWFPSGVSEFKLRTSYGTAGNVPAWSSQYETFSIGSGGVVSFSTLGNNKLRPEKMAEVEGGADIGLGTWALLGVTYAVSETRDQILPVTVPATTGFATQWQNVGTLQNKTWELSLTVPLVRSQDVTWQVRAIYDQTRTYVTELLVPPFNFGSAPIQATGSIFRMEEGERFGTFYGRKYTYTCEDLPNWDVNFQAQCGPGQAFQVNDDGFVVWVGAGNTPGDGVTKNLWEAQLPAAESPYGTALNYGMPIPIRDTVGGPVSTVPLGNSLPDFRAAFSTDFTWKRLTLYALLDMAVGQDVWNQGFHWAHLDFISADVDQQDKTLETAKPIGYYWRGALPGGSAAGVGGLYEALTPTSYMVESASYAKLRELMLSYRIGAIGGVGDWSVSVVGRNVFTITNYRGFDPEVGVQGGQSNSAAINAIDAFTFPNLRSVTVGVSATF